MLKTLLLTLLLLSLSACTGWHMRTSSISSNMNDITIVESKNNFALIKRELAKLPSIKRGPMNPDLRLQLHLLSENFTIKPSIIGTDGQTKFNRITYALSFKVLDNDGKVVIPEQSIISSNNTVYTDNNPLGLEQLNSETKQSLRRNAAYQLSLRLSIANDTQYENSKPAAN